MKDLILGVLFFATIVTIVVYGIATVVCAMNGQIIVSWITYVVAVAIVIFWFSVFAFGD